MRRIAIGCDHGGLEHKNAIAENLKNRGFEVVDEGKFGDGEYAEWFEGFNTALQNKLFLDKCKSIFEKIDLNDENLEKARSITEIGTNYNY